MSSVIAKNFRVRVAVPRPDDLTHVSLGISNGSQLYITAEGSTDVETIFDELRRAAQLLVNQVEIERRKHFTEEVHPKLTGCPPCPKGGVCSSGNPDECSCR